MLQLTSLAMVSAFFALLARANPRPELRWWTRAWAANLVALRRDDDLVAAAVRAAVPGHHGRLRRRQDGVRTAAGPGRVVDDPAGRPSFHDAAARRRPWRSIRLAPGSCCAISPRWASSSIRSWACILMMLAFTLWRSRADGVTWLIAGIAARGLLALGEAGAYVLQWQRPLQGPLAALVDPAGTFLSASSSFDMGAEWLVVLGSVLAVSERGRRALEASHHRLVLAQEDSAAACRSRSAHRRDQSPRAARHLQRRPGVRGDAAVLRSRRLQADQRSAWARRPAMIACGSSPTR